MVEMIYDSVGCSTCGSPVSRPKTIMFDRGELGFRHNPFTGNLDTLTAPAETLSYTYDAILPKSVKWSGEVKGSVSVEYDNNLRVTSQSVNGANAVTFSYDKDGLLKTAGTMNITREPTTGRIIGTNLGNVTTSQSYNALGELASYQAKYGTNTIFSTSYQRDSLGRITQLTETVQDQTKVMRYAYDIAGRLWKVWRNDTLISTYSYDPNGNRIAHWTTTKIDGGTYDTQDRLLQYANTQYLYTSNGELLFKIEGIDTTRYTYDDFGNLVTVILPNKDRIDYIIDGQNRRICKMLNGQIMNRWIYSGQLTPSAELDSAGNVVAQFIGSYMFKNGTTYQLITDHLGSVRLVVNIANCSIAHRLEYDEFGNVITNSNPDFQPFGYAGGLYDVQTKLTRFGARDYEASAGRWTNKDPLRFQGGDVNFYAYVFNEPIDGIDPSGFWKGSGHSDLTSRAMRQLGFTQGIETAVNANVNVDYNQLSNGLHYMYSYFDPEGAAESANNYIMEAFNKAVNAECEGNHNEAMIYLGRALHTVQDYFSHYAQGMDLVEHFMPGNDPDNSALHSDLYQEAYQATLSYLVEFQRRTKK